MRIWQSLTSAGLVFLASISPALAATWDSTRINLSVDVPVRCEVKIGGSAIWANSDTLDLGSLQQFCNAPNGYALRLDYTASTLAGATLKVGNTQVTLSGDGSDTLANSASPARFNADLVLSVAQNVNVPGDLRFIIIPNV